jgi:hypothetical protein
MRFYVGLHQPSDAKHLQRAFVSVVRLLRRKQWLGCPEWIMDSGAFSELAIHGHYRQGVETYATQIIRLAAINPELRAAVSQDYMCEPMILAKTGLSVAEHQRLTIERYDQLRELVRGAVYVMPVLQGYRVRDYLEHIDQYGERLGPGAYVGVGSICKRNGSPHVIEAVLTGIARARPDLRLHGFGLKTTALASDLVRRTLHSADSMAWSYAARREGRNRNNWREAAAFARVIETRPVQGWLFDATGTTT